MAVIKIACQNSHLTHCDNVRSISVPLGHCPQRKPATDILSGNSFTLALALAIYLFCFVCIAHQEHHTWINSQTSFPAQCISDSTQEQKPTQCFDLLLVRKIDSKMLNSIVSIRRAVTYYWSLAYYLNVEVFIINVRSWAYITYDVMSTQAILHWIARMTASHIQGNCCTTSLSNNACSGCKRIINNYYDYCVSSGCSD